MKRALFTPALICVSCVTSAMDFRCGNWEGEVTMPEDKPASVIYRVKEKGDKKANGLNITMFYNERPYEFQKLHITAESMYFTFNTGDIYTCKLNLDADGNYTGQCNSKETEQQRHISISMILPDNNYQICIIDTETMQHESTAREIPNAEK